MPCFLVGELVEVFLEEGVVAENNELYALVVPRQAYLRAQNRDSFEPYVPPKFLEELLDVGRPGVVAIDQVPQLVGEVDPHRLATRTSRLGGSRSRALVRAPRPGRLDQRGQGRLDGRGGRRSHRQDARRDAPGLKTGG